MNTTESINVTVLVDGVSIMLKPDATLPIRFLKAEALTSVRSDLDSCEVDVWVGPGLQRKLQDDLSLAGQRVADHSVLWLFPKHVPAQQSPQEQMAIEVVNAALDQLIKRGALHNCGEHTLHSHVLCTISAALQGMVSARELAPWKDEGSAHLINMIRPESDLFIFIDSDADKEYGPGHFGYGYFFHVGDVDSQLHPGNKRCYGYYRLDASQWLKEKSK